ncbi:MAG: YbjQ family protein [Acidimicrobiia bacterium]|nr:YbjQ family protein [Acidimicrobiia bacterium]
MSGVLLPLGITLGLILLGYFVGSSRERSHLNDLDRREAASSSVTVIDVKQLPPGMQASSGRLVSGEVVIAADYFKAVMAALRNLIGGEVKTYQTMLSRARREARLRMIEQAQQLGSDLVVNVRFELSDVGPKSASAEIFCYGTAIIAG